jgi:aminopeptidase N
MDKNETNLTYLKNYQPSGFFIEHIECCITLDPVQTYVHSKYKIIKNQEVTGDKRDLRLNGEELTLTEVLLNEHKLKSHEYQVSDNFLIIPNITDESFTLETLCFINPTANTALSGLYLSHGIFCTQCEAEGFRRITYYLDRPDVMATFTTRIVADKRQYPILLANGDCIDKGDLPDGKHWAIWHDSAKKPCYLFALVAGDLACQQDCYTTQSGRKVALRLYTEKGDERACGHALQVLKKAMHWDEQHYQREYDLSTYMIVAINDFNMGAMENKGLNIFNARCVLADSTIATDVDYAWIEAIVAHEYFHNWTGNRITCRDWFQLSLKEGLTVFREQQFCQDQGSPTVQRIHDVKRLWARQFPEDAGPLAHPVQPDAYLKIDNFYTMTIYEKGAEIVRMLLWILGEAGYYRGMAYYFHHYDGQAVTINELIGSMEKANQVNLQQFMRWYQQAGTPQVSIHTEYDAKQKIYYLHVSQQCPDTPGQTNKPPLMIPVVVGFLGTAGEVLHCQQQAQTTVAAEHILMLTEQQHTFTFLGVDQKPIPSIGRQFSAPVKWKYAYSEQELYTLAKHDPDGFNRWQATQTLYYRVLKSAMATASEDIFILEPVFIEFYEYLLHSDETDALLKAHCLTWPTQDEIAASLETIDVDAINRALMRISQCLATALNQPLIAFYHSHLSDGAYVFTPAEYGRRTLARLSLNLLNTLHVPEYAQMVYEHYDRANNMTDKMTALLAINHHDSEIRTQLLDMFYQNWQQHEAFFLDAWFQLQASTQLPSGYEAVKALCHHEKFTLKNPNRVRALLGTFTSGLNPNFHRIDGKGYQLLTEYVIKIDDLNPKLAANLLKPLIQWRRYDPQRQQHMRDCLHEIYQKPRLSHDCREIVSKAIV